MDFKNQWDTDNGEKSDDPVKIEPVDESKSVDLEKAVDSADAEAKTESPVETNAVDLERETIGTENTPKAPASDRLASIYPTPSTPSFGNHTLLLSKTDSPKDDTHKARRFLVAYITTVFSAISILFGTAWLGYVLMDHFFGPKKESTGFIYLDFAPLYISIMASLVVFGAIYIVASRYVAKSASNDTIGLKDWRAYKVVYAFFSALLIATGASIIAGLVYIPLAQLMIADDLDAKRIQVQTLASFHALLWIGVLIWQERLVKKAKQSWLQGFVVVASVALVVIATAVFPVGSKTDERYDNRVATDLSRIQTAISSYKQKNNNSLPESLKALTFDEEDTVKSRLNDYKYTVKSADQSGSQTSQQKVDVSASVFDKSLVDGTDRSASDMSDEEYYDSLYETMYMDTTVRSGSLTQSYELCATFRTDTTSKEDSGSSIDLLRGISGTASSYSFTTHKAGEVCFTRK